MRIFIQFEVDGNMVNTYVNGEFEQQLEFETEADALDFKVQMMYKGWKGGFFEWDGKEYREVK